MQLFETLCLVWQRKYSCTQFFTLKVHRALPSYSVCSANFYFRRKLIVLRANSRFKTLFKTVYRINLLNYSF